MLILELDFFFVLVAVAIGLFFLRRNGRCIKQGQCQSLPSHYPCRATPDDARSNPEGEPNTIPDGRSWPGKRQTSLPLLVRDTPQTICEAIRAPVT